MTTRIAQLIFRTSLVLALAISASSCDDKKSYSDLLNDETAAINIYMADQQVRSDIPADSVFVSREEMARRIIETSGTMPAGEAYYELLGRVMDSIAAKGSTDAPFYRLDEDGNVYMRVVKKGDPSLGDPDLKGHISSNSLIYMRFTRYNLSNYASSSLPVGEGNSQNMTYVDSFRYNNLQQSASKKWGSGIQRPLDFLYYDCSVELVIRSRIGRESEIASVVPYLYKVRYYKSQI